MNYLLKTAAALALIASPLAVQAAALRISPIGLDITADERAGSMTLVNTAAEPVNLQLRLFKWDQQNGEDVLTPTSEMLVTPPATTIPAGASYTVRVARAGAGPVSAERSYRLFIDELPKPVDPNTVGQGVSMVLRTSLPIFVVDSKAFAELSWKVWQDADGLHAQVTNAGKRHAKITDLALQQAGGQQISFGPGLNGYVLAGTSRRFDLAPAPGKQAPSLPVGTSLQLTATDNGQPITKTVDVTDPSR